MIDVLSKAKFVVFPFDTLSGDHETAVDMELGAAVKNRFPLNFAALLPPDEGDTYRGWKSNEHHFTTAYHRSWVLPLLEKMFGFGYSPGDFGLVHAEADGFDVSYLYPERGRWRIVCPTLNAGAEAGDLLFHEGYPYAYDAVTAYHRLYAFAHCVSVVENLSLRGGRRLLVACDSQMVPSIPVLANYYSEVFVVDNRFGVSLDGVLGGKEFDDVLVAMWRNAGTSAEKRLESCMRMNFTV